jgi:hypothetical protein
VNKYPVAVYDRAGVRAVFVHSRMPSRGRMAMQRISEILSPKLIGPDDQALETERRETFRRTSAEWAGMPEDLGDESSRDEVRCHCSETVRPVDAFVRGGVAYCGACLKQIDDIARGE